MATKLSKRAKHREAAIKKRVVETARKNGRLYALEGRVKTKVRKHKVRKHKQHIHPLRADDNSGAVTLVGRDPRRVWVAGVSAQQPVPGVAR